MRALIYALHGIDSDNEDSFVEPFEDFIAVNDKDMTVLSHEYTAGPLPLFNNWWLDGRLATDIYQQILKVRGTRPIYLVAYSNGTVIALRVAKMLAAFGIRVGGIILIAGAIEANIERNGIQKLFSTGKLGLAAAYCSHEDDVVRGDPRADTTWWGKLKDRVWGACMWPYGSLGVTGWLSNNQPTGDADLITRWYRGGHSGYFHPPQEAQVFTQILSDIHAHS